MALCSNDLDLEVVMPSVDRARHIVKWMLQPCCRYKFSSTYCMSFVPAGRPCMAAATCSVLLNDPRPFIFLLAPPSRSGDLRHTSLAQSNGADSGRDHAWQALSYSSCQSMDATARCQAAASLGAIALQRVTDDFGVSPGLYSCPDNDQARQPMRRCIRTYVLGYSECDVVRMCS